MATLALAAALAGCADDARNESVKIANLGNGFIASKHYDDAIVQMKKAVELYGDNHLAWYGMGSSYIARKQWAEAVDALNNAVRVVDDQPMYHMWLGIAQRMKAITQAKEELARREEKKPEEVDPDLASINFESAIQHLQQAVKLRSEMWRANYNLGLIYRDTERAKEAAESLSRAISANPREQGPYVALAELYLRWDYVDQAIQIASQGTANVPGSSERSDIWFVLGMGYDAKRLDDKAIEAFTKALDDRRDNHKAKFQRGQAEFRKGDYVRAKRDLEDFAKTGSAKLTLEKSQATKILMDIAAKGAEAPANP
ncbi:MAG: tetratricopeptide repeat protein [Kofleriaceae bacterium]